MTQHKAVFNVQLVPNGIIECVIPATGKCVCVLVLRSCLVPRVFSQFVIPVKGESLWFCVWETVCCATGAKRIRMPDAVRSTSLTPLKGFSQPTPQVCLCLYTCAAVLTLALPLSMPLGLSPCLTPAPAPLTLHCNHRRPVRTVFRFRRSTRP